MSGARAVITRGLHEFIIRRVRRRFFKTENRLRGLIASDGFIGTRREKHNAVPTVCRNNIIRVYINSISSMFKNIIKWT